MPVAERRQNGESPVAEPAPSEILEALKNDLLTVYKAVLALEKKVIETAVSSADVRPQLVALKAHTESFPNALREARRSDVAVQKSLAQFEARLRALEARLNTVSPDS